MTYNVRGVCPCGDSCSSERTDGVLRYALLDVSSALRAHIEQMHDGEGIRDDDGLVIKSVTTRPERSDHVENMRQAHEFICDGYPIIIVCEFEP